MQLPYTDLGGYQESCFEHLKNLVLSVFLALLKLLLFSFETINNWQRLSLQVAFFDAKTKFYLCFYHYYDCCYSLLQPSTTEAAIRTLVLNTQKQGFLSDFSIIIITVIPLWNIQKSHLSCYLESRIKHTNTMSPQCFLDYHNCCYTLLKKTKPDLSCYQESCFIQKKEVL